MGILPSKTSTKNFEDFCANEIPASLEGKTIAITGCTSGTGLIAAKVTVQKNASTLLMLNRPSSRSKAAVEEVKKCATESSNSGGSTTNVVHVDCDLQDFESVKKAAAEINKTYDKLDVLANNAGIMAVEDKATKDGFDVQMQTNHLSHFLLTKELFPLLKKADGEARIVNHSSMARSGPPLEAKYFGKNGGNLGGDSDSFFAKEGKWERYHQSKLANATYTTALAARLDAAAGDTAASNVKAVCAAPGLAATSLQHTSTGMSGEGVMMWFAQSAEDGALGLIASMYQPGLKNGTFREPWNGWYGKPVEKPFDKLSRDKEQQDILWKESEAAVGGAFSVSE